MLSNISRDRGHQTMKFSQLVEHKMGKPLLEKLF